LLTLRPIQYCDLALKSDKDPGVRLKPDGTVDADWFCMVTASRVGALVYLLDLYRGQIPFPEQVRVLKREHNLWKSRMIGIESNAYQWALGQQAWEVGLPVVPVPAPGDKVYKAQLATPHFETGRVRIRGVKENGIFVAHPCFRSFIREAIDFPYGGNDDTVDAVCGAVIMCTSEEFIGKELAVASAPGFSIALSGGLSGHRLRRGQDVFDVFPSSF
jgi:phage terminase large subunit-like protein